MAVQPQLLRQLRHAVIETNECPLGLGQCAARLRAVEPITDTAHVSSDQIRFTGFAHPQGNVCFAAPEMGASPLSDQLQFDLRIHGMEFVEMRQDKVVQQQWWSRHANAPRKCRLAQCGTLQRLHVFFEQTRAFIERLPLRS